MSIAGGALKTLMIWAGALVVSGRHHMPKNDATDAARALAARRPRAVIVCEVCQQERTVVVMGKGRAARTCGPTCRSKLHRQRKRQNPEDGATNGSRTAG